MIGWFSMLSLSGKALAAALGAWGGLVLLSLAFLAKDASSVAVPRSAEVTALYAAWGFIGLAGAAGIALGTAGLVQRRARLVAALAILLGIPPLVVSLAIFLLNLGGT